MKKQYFINTNIIDPHNSINENGGLITGEDGLIEAIGKKVNSSNIPSREKVVDLKSKHIFPGLVDMRVFAGEPGYEYKENFRTLSNAALAGGVTSVVTMPNTDPIIPLLCSKPNSVILIPSIFFVSAALGKTLILDLSLPRLFKKSTIETLSIIGSVFGIVTTDVTPPASAALLKVLKFSLYS